MSVPGLQSGPSSAQLLAREPVCAHPYGALLHCFVVDHFLPATIHGSPTLWALLARTGFLLWLRGTDQLRFPGGEEGLHPI